MNGGVPSPMEFWGATGYSLFSKYSTRDLGVCRDEIAIAIGVKGGNIQTILVRKRGSAFGKYWSYPVARYE